MIVYGPKGEFLLSLNAAEGRILKEELNLMPIFMFMAPSEFQKKLPLEGKIETEFGDYILKEKQKSGGWYNYVCTPDIGDLRSELLTKAYVTVTASEMGSDLLEGSGWRLECAETEKRTVTLNGQTRYAGILAIIDRFGYEVEWDIKGKIITLAPRIGRENSGLYIHDQVNLRDISPSADSYDLFTKITPYGADGLGIESVNGGLPYLENYSYTTKVIPYEMVDNRFTNPESLKAAASKLLEERSKVRQAYEADVSDLAKAEPGTWGFLDFRVGDSVDLISTQEGIEDRQRIISRIRYLDELDGDVVVIANTLRNHTESQEEDVEELRNSYASTKASLELLDASVRSKVSDETYGQDRENLEGQLNQMVSDWEQTADGFRQEVSKDYTSKTEFSEYQQTLATKFEQDEKSFDFKFTEVEKSIETVDGQQVEKFNEIEKHITFESGEILLRADSSDPALDTSISLRIGRDRISFLSNGAEVAYFSDNKLYVTDGHFLNSLRVGAFSFRPRSNGSLSFGKVN